MIESKKKGRLVIFKGSGNKLEQETREVAALKPGELLVENLYTTLCGSDLHTYTGLRNEVCPTILGHEIVGRIIEISDQHPKTDFNGKAIQPGDVITWTIFSSDPHCHHSLAGRPQKGDSLFKYGHALANGDDVFHGGLAEYCILKKDTTVLKIPPSLPLPIAATVNCAAATVAGAVRLAGELRDKRVLITGMGLLGIFAVSVCKEAGASWVGAADITERRLVEAANFGADAQLNSIGWGTLSPDEIKATLPGGEVDVVFDMSGSADAMEQGISLLGIGGIAVWVGAVFKTRDIRIDAEQVIRRLLTIRGLHNYNYTDINDALRFLVTNWQKYPFHTVVEKEFSLDEAEEAFAYALAHKPLRVGIKIATR